MAEQWDYAWLTPVIDPQNGLWRGVRWQVAGQEAQDLVQMQSWSSDDFSMGGRGPQQHSRAAIARHNEFFAYLGQQGWELVSVSGTTKYFKHPRNIV